MAGWCCLRQRHVVYRMLRFGRFAQKLAKAPSCVFQVSSQRRLGPSTANITLNQPCVTILPGQNMIGTICLIRLCSGLGGPIWPAPPSLRWDDEKWNQLAREQYLADLYIVPETLFDRTEDRLAVMIEHLDFNFVAEFQERRFRFALF